MNSVKEMGGVQIMTSGINPNNAVKHDSTVSHVQLSGMGVQALAAGLIGQQLLMPYSVMGLGLPKSIIPLMSVVWKNKRKVCPVMDYRDLKRYIDPFTSEC